MTLDSLLVFLLCLILLTVFIVMLLSLSVYFSLVHIFNDFDFILSIYSKVAKDKFRLPRMCSPFMVKTLRKSTTRLVGTLSKTQEIIMYTKLFKKDYCVCHVSVSNKLYVTLQLYLHSFLFLHLLPSSLPHDQPPLLQLFS